MAEAKSRELILSTKITRLETELVTLTDRFKQSETDLRVTREELVVKEGELEVKQVELVGVKGELEVEKVVADVYERGEERLDGIAGVLKTVAKESLGDLDGVFGKLGESTTLHCFSFTFLLDFEAFPAHCFFRLYLNLCLFYHPLILSPIRS